MSSYIQGAEGRYTISGELSFATVAAVLAESHSTLFASAPSTLEVDLAEVSRADSAGLSLLLQWMRMAQADNRSIRFHHLPGQLYAIAQAGDLLSLLPIAE